MVQTIIWAGLLVAFIVIEAATVQLLTIWFAAGSLAALIASLAGAQIWLQIAIFFGISIVALAATRPFVKRFTKNKFEPTNADRCIGSDAIVTEDIDNIKGSGAVNVKGIIWTARSTNDSETIEKGEAVIVKQIDGVKLLVARKEVITK